MRLEGPGQRLTIFIGETDQHHHKPLSTEIVHRAHAAGLAGATVVRGLEGYGASRHVHTIRILSLSEDLPVIVVIVDKPERIDAFLPELDKLITEGLVVRERVEIEAFANAVASTAPRLLAASAGLALAAAL
jgi:uncharacterized protein